MEQVQNKPSKVNFSVWIKKVGFVGFLFFLIKGLVWLAIFFGIGKIFG